mmetsp:Transcript_10941/g.15653  ORF Transcript_10941/g.15653 Transcript_10941/m.15653 type:complete len:218 (-) Transcript_10941:46-699(-)
MNARMFIQNVTETKRTKGHLQLLVPVRCPSLEEPTILLVSSVAISRSSVGMVPYTTLCFASVEITTISKSTNGRKICVQEYPLAPTRSLSLEELAKLLEKYVATIQSNVSIERTSEQSFVNATKKEISCHVEEFPRQPWNRHLSYQMIRHLEEQTVPPTLEPTIDSETDAPKEESTLSPVDDPPIDSKDQPQFHRLFPLENSAIEFGRPVAGNCTPL